MLPECTYVRPYCDLQVMEEVLVTDFDVAYEVSQAYGLDAQQGFVELARKLAQAGAYEAIEELLKNMKSTSNVHECDQVAVISALLKDPSRQKHGRL